MAAGQWIDARGAIRAFWSTFGRELTSEEALHWRKLDVRISEKTGDLARLVWLEQQSPELVREMESVSLMLIRTFNASGQTDDATRLRADWRGRELHPSLWLALDVDQHLARGERDEALALLHSVEFDGPADVGRRLRLAFLAANPTEAWTELTAAVQADPRNPDARSFRAQLLERAGAIEDARIEFVAALVAAPEDPVRRDQLAEFYRRHGSPGLALQTWRDGVAPSAPDFFWVRVLFWERLWQTSGDALIAPPTGSLTHLINGLSDLPLGVFWNDGVIPDPAALRLAETRPEVSWLRLLELLRTGKEREAQLAIDRFTSSADALAPLPLAVIRSVLRWRIQELAPIYGEMPVAPPGVVAHTLIDEFRAWPADGLSAETNALVKGPHVWTAVMLGLGWSEAALAMNDPDGLVADPAVPDWVHYGVAMALRQNRGGEIALEYLAAAPKVPMLQLLAGEIRWSGGASAEESGLADLATLPGGVGYRAAWLLTLRALELEQWSEAKRWATGQAELAQSISGRELLARTALLSGQEEEAVRLYTALGVDSLEAGMFLARRAFAAGNWVEARTLTEDLLVRFPGELELRGNLEAIAQAEAAAAQGATP